MITVEYCRMMARYNAWQNRGLMDVLKSLKPAELTRDRKAFFGSILGTANHLLWGDRLWMSRFDGGFAPKERLAESPQLHDTLQLYLDDRIRTDARISRWAAGLSQVGLRQADEQTHAHLCHPFLQPSDPSSRPDPRHVDGGRAYAR